MTEKQFSVLLINKEPKEIKVIRQLLDKAEDVAFQIECAEDLSTGLERVTSDNIDVILLDLFLPDGQGLDTLAKVHDKAPGVPVVVLTGTDNSIGPKTLAQGAQGYLMKGQITSMLLTYSLVQAIERSIVEKESTYNDKRFQALIENSTDAIVIVATDGEVLYKSPSLARLLDYKQDENLGHPGFPFVHPDDLPKMAQVFMQVLQSNSAPICTEVRAKDRSGTWHYFEATASNHINDPAVSGIVVNLRDISERKRAQEALRESETRYRLIADKMTDAIFIMDLTWHFSYWSPSITRLLSFAPEEAVALTADQILPPQHFEHCARILVEELAADTTGQVDLDRNRRIEVQLYRKDGTTVWVDLNVTFLRDTKGKPTAVIGAVRDISERKRAEEELRGSDERLRDALERLRVSHEALSTPVVQIWDGVLALPLIGLIDDRRAQQIMETLLTRIVETQSGLVILDVTAVTSMDSSVTDHLFKTIKSVSLLGAQCVLTGIRPEVSQAVTGLGLDMSRVMVKRDMQDGLKWALQTQSNESRDGPISEATRTSAKQKVETSFAR